MGTRSTQYIGLTKAAHEFVKSLKSLDPDTHTNGMFDEKIPLRRWAVPENMPAFDGLQDRPTACIREVVQASPWSSGPMLFLCLEADYGNDAKAQMFEWINDPNLHGSEYDQETGRMWV